MSEIFWKATSCSLQYGQQHFVGICCVYIQGLPFCPEVEEVSQTAWYYHS